LGLGLSRMFDKAGLGSSLGAGDGSTAGLVMGNRVSEFHPKCAARGEAYRQRSTGLLRPKKKAFLLLLMVLVGDGLHGGRPRGSGSRKEFPWWCARSYP
jgi:hypothetical protein